MQATVQAGGKHLPSGQYTMTGSLYHVNKSPALKLVKDGDTFAVVTVCIPEYTLEQGEFLIKTWSENEGIAESLIESGVLVDTGKRVPTGFCEAMVCRLCITLE